MSQNERVLADPGSCGVRLGGGLRRMAERAAHERGICLSHWIKRAVREKLGLAERETLEAPGELANFQQSDSSGVSAERRKFEAEYGQLMEELK